MSDENQVLIADDNGHKNRWGLEKLLYRKEGRKRSLNAKVTAWLMGLTVFLGSTYSVISEFFKPTPSDNGSPIGFNDSLPSSQANGPNIQVPAGTSEYNRPQSTDRSKRRSVEVYSAPQVIERPNLGKIPPGVFAKAKFVTGASNGPLKAVLVEPVSINGEEIVPEGTVLIGHGSSGEDRLTVQFAKMVLQNGKSQNIQAQACDLSDQTVGVKGQKMSKYAVLLATSAGLNFLGGVAEGLQETQVQNGAVVKKSDLRNAALNGASKAALDQSQAVLSDMKNQKSIIQVEKGKEFYVLFEGD